MRRHPVFSATAWGSPMSAVYPPEQQQSPPQPPPLPPHRSWPRRHKILTALGSEGQQMSEESRPVALRHGGWDNRPGQPFRDRKGLMTAQLRAKVTWIAWTRCLSVLTGASS
jgi:hypothetical protein